MMGSCLVILGLPDFVFYFLYLLLYTAHLEPADFGTEEMIFILFEKRNRIQTASANLFDPKQILIWVFYPE
jgi:hypothetical protein